MSDRPVNSDTQAALASGRAAIRQAGAGYGFMGKLNVYVCEVCRGKTITRDLEAGVTPFLIQCRAKPGCKGHAQSLMYRCDQDLKETHQWRLPKPSDILSEGELNHVANGGLLLREAG